MKFPLRLTLDLWRGRLAGAGAGLVFQLPAALLPELHENGMDAGGGSAHSAADSVRAALRTKAPVLWIGGREPLEHAEVGRVAFALNAKGRNVFLHTDGQRLRQRIHEFRPDPRLFLTVELLGREEIHDRRSGRPGAFRRVIEGIRAAKLSGFHVCTHVTVSEETEICETGELFEYLDRYDVDGYILSSGVCEATSGARASKSQSEENLEELRALIRCNRWENFSRLLEASYGEAAKPREQPKTVAMPAPVQAEESEPVEESA